MYYFDKSQLGEAKEALRRGKRVFLTTGPGRKELHEAVELLYAAGGNSLFMKWDGSFHDAQYDIGVSRATTGRKVSDPHAWIDKIRDRAEREAIRRWELSRRNAG